MFLAVQCRISNQTFKGIRLLTSLAYSSLQLLERDLFIACYKFTNDYNNPNEYIYTYVHICARMCIELLYGLGSGSQRRPFSIFRVDC